MGKELPVRLLNVCGEGAQRLAVTQTLRDAGFFVEEAGSGADALAIVRALRPDLVMLDLALRAPSAADVCAAIRADAATASTLVLYLSSPAPDGARRSGKHEGEADAYLNHPVESDELVATVRALVRLRRAEAAARRAACEWRTTFDAISDAACLLDLRGRVVRCNRAMAALLGRGFQDVLGQRFSELVSAALGPAELPSFDDGLPRREVLEMQVGERWFRITVDPVRDEEDRLCGVVHVVADLTEHRRLEEELRRRAEALVHSDARKDEFLAVLAHELRNPIGAVNSAVHLLCSGGSEDDGPRLQAIIQRQVKHLVRLVDQLLDVSRINTGKIRLGKRRLELGAAVADAVQAASGLVESAGHVLELRLPREPLSVDADPTRVEQIVANLLDNSSKYTPRGGRITVLVEQERDSAVLRVRDNGIGIPPEALGRIFDLFAQAEVSLDRSRGGMGLGLTLVRQLVTLHDGEITATSDGAGRGSEFVVRLPLAGEREAAALPEPPPAPAPPTVLLVEDNDDARELLREMILRWGYSVAVARDGRAGAQMATALRPVVALVDIGLPELDGYAVARQVRANLGDTLVMVAITGYGQGADCSRALEAGFDVHMVKPVEVEALRALLSEAHRVAERRPSPAPAPRGGVERRSGERRIDELVGALPVALLPRFA